MGAAGIRTALVAAKSLESSSIVASPWLLGAHFHDSGMYLMECILYHCGLLLTNVLMLLERPGGIFSAMEWKMKPRQYSSASEVCRVVRKRTLSI